VKVGRLHLVLSLLMLGAAVSYNVWALTRTAATAPTARTVAPVDALPAPAASPAVAADPMQIAAPADVSADRTPQWAHDPFSNTFAAPPATAAAPPPAPAPEVVVAMILYGEQRQLAIVNGRIVGVGDAIGDSSIVAIEPRGITLDGGPRGRRTVALRAPGAVKEPR
jgi:hypothetical protein